MGTTCSSPKHHEVEAGTNHSDVASSKGTLDHFPGDLVQLLLKETNPTPLPSRNAKMLSPSNTLFVSKMLDCANLEDTEALVIYGALARVMDEQSRAKAARNLNNRGYPNEALACFGMMTHLEDVQSLVADIQKVRLHRWSRPEMEFVEYTKFWGTKELSGPVQRCKDTLTNCLQTISGVATDRAAKFGIKGILDDRPHPDSLSLRWPKEGNLNTAEQEKAGALFMMSLLSPQRPRIENINRNPTPASSAIFPRRLYSKIACRIPGVRFIKVQAISALKNHQSLGDLPPEAYTNIGHFAVSCSVGDGAMLERLQRVLKTVDGILPTDGVFIDCSRDSSERTDATLFAKAIFEQCHVIFLPPPDYFCQARCMLECMAWFLSPFPNQALGDFDLANSLIFMSMTTFGKPPFFLDRPQLQLFGRMAMNTTNDHEQKEFFTSLLDNNRFKSMRLRESLTKLVFKLESTIMV